MFRIYVIRYEKYYGIFLMKLKYMKENSNEKTEFQ